MCGFSYCVFRWDEDQAKYKGTGLVGSHNEQRHQAAGLHDPEKQSAPCSPGAVHSRAEKQIPADQNTAGNTVNLCFSTSSAFCKQHKERHIVSVNVSANKDANNSRAGVSIWALPGPRRSFAQCCSSSLFPFFLIKILNKYPLNQLNKLILTLQFECGKKIQIIWVNKSGLSLFF